MNDWKTGRAKLLILADGHLDTYGAKTAVGLLRYRPRDVVAVLDRQNAGGDLNGILGVGEGISIVGSLEEARPLNPSALVIGVVTPGGKVPVEWRGIVLSALTAGMNVINGLHERLATDQEMVAAAGKGGGRIYDLRQPDRSFDVGAGRARHTRGRRILTVGSDCNVGKMVAALEIASALRRRGLDARFVATGQTGLMISGSGVCLDAVRSDFVAGAAEAITVEQADADVIVVEGQGSLLHPGFSAVALGILHGVLPDCMIMVHEPRRTHFRRTDLPIPPLREMIRLHEEIARPLHPSPVVGVALNCFGMIGDEARQAVDCLASDLRLPVTDCLRFGAEVLADAVMEETIRSDRTVG